MRLTFLLTFLFFSFYLNAQIIDFESTVPHIQLDTSAGNLWQIGPPQKTLFDAARSPVNALMTDTINNYPPNTHTSFTYEIYDPVSVDVAFWYRIDSEEGMDGAYLEVSVDTGQTWHLLDGGILDLYPPNAGTGWISVGTYMYTPFDTLYNGVNGVSGSKGWTKAGVNFLCTAVKNMNLSVLIRFNFISNGSIEGEGWMLDDFGTTYSPCSSNENITANELNIHPNPASERLILDFGDSLLKGQLQVTNVMGQAVKLITDVEDYSLELDVSDLPTGIYFYQFETDEELIYTGKFLISRE